MYLKSELCCFNFFKSIVVYPAIEINQLLIDKHAITHTIGILLGDLTFTIYGITFNSPLTYVHADITSLTVGHRTQ